jgi:transcriptional regulator with GAF, ATPase, and Fis domain
VIDMPVSPYSDILLHQSCRFSRDRGARIPAARGARSFRLSKAIRKAPPVMPEVHDEAIDMPAVVRALAGIMLGDARADAVLQRACEATKAVIPGADEVSVTLVAGDHPRTVAATGALADEADQKQYAAGEGPCLDAARSGAPVLVEDVTADPRWPSYAPAAAAGGVRGSLSVPLAVDSATAGALNMYSRQASAFDDDAVAVAFDLAHYTGVVASAADEWTRATALAQQMQEAMESRAVIEQAKGILISEHHCSPDKAFQLLVRMSQETHRKLREVAESLVEQAVSG